MVRHVSYSEGKDIIKTQIEKHYNDKFQKINDENHQEINSEILKFVESLKTYVSVMACTSSTEQRLQVVTKSNEIYNAIFKVLLYSGHIYKPFHPLVISLHKLINVENGDDAGKMTKIMLQTLYWHIVNAMHKDFSAFIKSNNFRPRVPKFLLTKPIGKLETVFKKAMEDIFEINRSDRNVDVLNRSKNKFYDYLFDICHTNTDFHNKTLKWLILMRIQGTNNYFDFKNNFEIEHVKESINKEILKDESNLFIVPLEKELHREMNNEIKTIIKNGKTLKVRKVEITATKAKFYSKSNCEFTKYFGKQISLLSSLGKDLYSLNKKNMKHMFVEFLSEQNFVEELLK